MQTELSKQFRETPQGEVAESILRKCVHCGFCTATCPTYLLLGNELDSPRGRIYLMKQMLEGEPASERTQLHLDRCLTCRSCETTCPSGVEYGRLLDIGREFVDQQVPRGLVDRMMRKSLQLVIPNPMLLRVMLWFARLSKPFLPGSIRNKIPSYTPAKPWPKTAHPRRMIIHQGCIQRVVKPSINAAAARYLDSATISPVSVDDVCCGALGLHLGNHNFFKRYAKRNIDAWWPHLETGAEAIVSTASGCGVTIKEYGDLLKDDPDYAQKAQRVAEMTIDISEIDCGTEVVSGSRPCSKVAFHSPCTLQHGQKIDNSIVKILHRHGVTTTPVENPHLCCGSAGAYSIMQPAISSQLLENKLSALQQNSPECIVTANIGCLMHLETKSDVPVRHWVEIVAP